jgi:hypothetical protein
MNDNNENYYIFFSSLLTGNPIKLMKEIDHIINNNQGNYERLFTDSSELIQDLIINHENLIKHIIYLLHIPIDQRNIYIKWLLNENYDHLDYRDLHLLYLLEDDIGDANNISKILDILFTFGYNCEYIKRLLLNQTDTVIENNPKILHFLYDNCLDLMFQNPRLLVLYDKFT